MVEAIGLTVVKLHRTSFGGISLKGVKEGDWAELTAKEMTNILKAIEQSEQNSGTAKSKVFDNME